MHLPVHDISEELLAAAKAGGRLLLRAPTGSGKSTAVPALLAESGAVRGRILVVQPRRIAARLLAEFVARLQGVRLGREVGYAVRFDANYTEETRILYLTDGVLQRWLREDPDLDGVGAVIFDEFHERRLASDLALARVLRMQDGPRPDLKLLVMSATLETAGLADYLEPCDVLEAGGRLYPVDIEYRSPPPPKRGRHGAMETVPIWEQVGKAVREEVERLKSEEGETVRNRGHVGPRILVFLPGGFEIRKTQELLERSAWTSGWEVKPLYSALAPKAQGEAIGPGEKPRIIVSTNVAETSITIEGIRTVIDSGVARVAAYDPRRGIDTLTIRKISRAAAEQRAGRAGRTGPGRCVRLWSERDQARREEFERPEVRRVDLAEAVLYLKAGGVSDVRGFRWLDAPEDESLERAERLLAMLGAIDAHGEVTERGLHLARFPLHPRAARLLEAAEEEGCLPEACFAAAVMQGGGAFARSASRSQRGEFQTPDDRSDMEAQWRACSTAEAMRFDPTRCGAMGIHAKQCRETLQVWRQLCGLAGRPGTKAGHVDVEEQRVPLGRAMLAAYGDHVGVRMSKGTLASRVVGGRRGKLDEASVAREARLFASAEMTEVEGKAMTVTLQHAVAIEEAWLRELFPDAFREESGAVYDETARRVTARRRTLFFDLVIEDKEGGTANDEEAADLLAGKVLDGTLKLKKWDVGVERWLARVGFVAEAMPELELSPIGEDEKRLLVAQVCTGARSYREIKDREVRPALRQWLSAPQAAALAAYAPERIELTNGAHAKVVYEAGQPPMIGLKVQQLYGVDETPQISGKPVRVQVLAPNQRPWQVTQDLASFWETGYPQMKKDLAGRYPKHQWR